MKVTILNPYEEAWALAKGNDGNYLQHCIEVEAAVRLAQSDQGGRLHVAFTHGMKPFERICNPKGATHSLLYGALGEAASEPECAKRQIAKAYRESWALQEWRPNIADLFHWLRTGKHYPNSAELMRAVIGADRLSGGITENHKTKCEQLSEAWSDSNVKVSDTSWRNDLKEGSVLHCPDDLDRPWLFSMDPMTYTENGRKDNDLHRSDLAQLASALKRYFESGQPGIACVFAYGVGIQRENPQRQFWTFVDDLAECLRVDTYSYWVAHRGGSLNLAGMLFSAQELVLGFAPPRIKPGRGRQTRRLKE